MVFLPSLVFHFPKQRISRTLFYSSLLTMVRFDGLLCSERHTCLLQWFFVLLSFRLPSILFEASPCPWAANKKQGKVYLYLVAPPQAAAVYSAVRNFMSPNFPCLLPSISLARSVSFYASCEPKTWASPGYAVQILGVLKSGSSNRNK